MFADLALIAVATEAMVGYPDAVYRLVGHPVTWMGRLIAWCDEAWNSPALSFETRRSRGVAALLLLLAVAILSGLVVTDLVASLFPASSPCCSAACWAAACWRSAASTRMWRPWRPRWSATVSSRPAGRVADRRPRDGELDEAAVCRAAIESLAENFSDGVVAPLFWMVFAGLPGALAYKAINTADSMIGHKSSAISPSAGRRRAATIW